MSKPENKMPSQNPAPNSPAAVGLHGRLLVTEKLVKEYRIGRVVNGVSISVAAGEIVGLLGPNGAGKTTTFNIVVGVVKPEEGVVQFQDRNITGLPMHKRARLGIGYLTQEPSIFRKLTVEENVLAILEPARCRARSGRAVEIPARGAGHDAAGEKQGLHVERRRGNAGWKSRARWSPAPS